MRDADAKFGKGGGSTADTPLPYVNLTATLTEREWLVADRIPMGALRHHGTAYGLPLPASTM